MCGIAGILTTRGLPAAELAAAARRMADIQAHRGPDDSGVWCDPAAGVALGFRRLAILDLSEAGHQPMESASGRYFAVFNGEVYNHEALRSELRLAGFRFRGHSDTEVILAGFEHWGIRSTVERFVGMFGIAVWDRADRKLTLIRDRLGIKPIYVYRDHGLVTFSSELKGLIAGPSFKGDLDQDAIAEYLRYLYVPGPRSVYQSVIKLLPGHLLEIGDASAPLPAPTAYWSAEEAAMTGAAAPFGGSDAEAITALDSLLREAVGLRMVADVPVGALLSGGIDSSTVVALMQALSSQKVRTYTIGFDVPGYDEAKHAAAVARVLKTDHTECRVDGGDALRLVPEMARRFDEPLADPSILPTFLVCQVARRDVTVALTGDGGDELFAGYNRYVDGRWMIGGAGAMPARLRGFLAAGTRFLGDDSADPRSLRGRVGKIGRLLGATTPGEMYRSLHSAWLNPREVIPGATELPGPFVEAIERPGPLDLLSRMQLVDQRVYLADDLLGKVDRASMAVSLEARVPLLDHRVVEFAWRLPARLKIRGQTGKWLLRQVLFQYVPRELVERPKMGFSVPIDAWLRGPLREWGSDLLASKGLDELGFLDGGAIRAAWRAFQTGRGPRGLAIWAVLIFLAWHDEWNAWRLACEQPSPAGVGA